MRELYLVFPERMCYPLNTCLHVIKKRQQERREHYMKVKAGTILRITAIAAGMIALCGMSDFRGIKVQAQSAKVLRRIEVTRGNGESKRVKLWTIPHNESNIYTNAYRRRAETTVKGLKNKKKYTLGKPLVIQNPYGTFSTSVYFYAKAKQACYASYTVKAGGTETVTRDLKNDRKYSKKQEYLLTGLVAGKKNNITMRFYNRAGKQIRKIQFTVGIKKDKEIPAIESIENGNSAAELSEGVYAIIGHDRQINSNVYFFDNEGVNRGKIPLNNYRADRLVTVNGKLIYPYAPRKFAVLNRLGKIVKKIDLGKYKMHHDFMYDENTNSLLVLATDTGKDTIEDVIISVNLKTGKKKLVVDWEKLMPDIRKMAVWNKETDINTYGTNDLDWIHLNSLDLVSADEMVVSSRELSTIIKISGLHSEPKVDYIIHGGNLFDNTVYQSKQLSKIGDFQAQSGQHTITVEQSDELEKGQYYLYMYNNNFAFSYTLPFYNWKQFYPEAANFLKEVNRHSYYFKYLVDERKGTYELVQSIELPYSKLISGVQHYKGNVTFGSGFDHTYGEYDKNGTLIRMFRYKAEKYAYRVTKYNFRGFFYRKKNWNL